MIDVIMINAIMLSVIMLSVIKLTRSTQLIVYARVQVNKFCKKLDLLFVIRLICGSKKT
jgi:hypothetical protein